MLYINRGQEKEPWFCLNTKTKCKTDTKKHASQTLKGAVVIFDDDLPLKTALNDRTRSQFFKQKTTSMSTLVCRKSCTMMNLIATSEILVSVYSYLASF